MTETRGQRAKALFEQVLDLPPEDRDAFLEDACGSDRDLEEDVRSLVEAHEESGGFLGSGQVGRALADLSTLSTGPDDPLTGAVIGDYEILGLLARGGMGAVYRAEQEHPRREVALKLIDRSIVTPELLRRFEVEAQVLARLKHPGIAQIHVAGSAGPEHGDRPYFAMELVDGRPLTTFADERDLGLRERLELLIKICEAVQYAHQVGVIHRDLKPANILVTADGQPKILDFGVARSTDADLQVTTLADGQAMLIGTLPYMSPEQVRADPDELDTRSDVHALGVLCFELLTGRLPRELEGKPLTDAIRTIVEEEPRALGEAANRRFPADLETIVAKALEADRDRRYDSASEFAADLQRFIDGQPISARPPSAVYQLRKLVVRNRLPAVLVVGLVLLIVASAVALALQARRVAGERDRANLEAVSAAEVSLFLENLFLEADPEMALGETLTAREILDRGAERIRTELQDQPEVRGRVLVTLGQVYASLGLAGRAEPLLEEAVEIGRQLQTGNDKVTDRSNLELALCLLAGRRAGQGRNDEAIVMCREALELAGAVHGEESINYATCLNHLAYNLSLTGANDEAREMNERGLALREKLLGPEDVDVGWSVFQYAWLLRGTGDREGARAQFERACAIWEKALPENHPQLARCLHDYSQLLIELEEHDAAREPLERALAIQRKTLGLEHPAIPDTLNDLGLVHWHLGDLAEASRRFSEAVEGHKRSRGEADLGLLDRLQSLAMTEGRRNRPDEEEAARSESLDLALEHHGGSPAVVAEALGRLGFFYVRQGRRGEARPLLRDAAETFEEVGESRDEDRVTMLTGLLGLLDEVDEAEEALSVHRQLLAIRLAHPDWTRLNPFFLRYRIGLCLLVLARLEEAESLLLELLPEGTRAFDVNAFFPWNVRWLLGHCRYRRGAEEEARAHYDAVLGVDPESLSDDLHWLRLRRAEDHGAEGRIDEARRELKAALEAGLDARRAEMALAVNPRLGPEARRELLLLLEGR